MAMTVRYNDSANHVLNYLGQNDKSCSKALAKLASGMKINSAQDDAANFSISSRMKVKLRALEQDTQNVQNGSAILRTAEGGIQRQIDLIRTIRAKVIDAANDSNNDEDRQTIQKELHHLYEQMESIAYETDFNSKKPLLANDRTSSDGGIDRTALNIIPDEYPVLDDITGPFDIFSEYSSSTVNLGTTTGYIPGRPQIMSVDFANYADDISQLNNVGLNIGGSTYVFTDDTSKNYLYASRKISLGNTVEETIANLRLALGFTEVEGTKLTLYASSISGRSAEGGTSTTSVRVSHTGTGAGVSGTTSGGVTNATGDADLPDAAPATLTVDLSGVTSNTGFRFDGINFRVIDSGATVEGTVDRTLIKGESSSGRTTSLFDYTFDGSNLTFTARNNGTAYNGYKIVNSYTYYTWSDKTTEYTAYTAFSGATEVVSPQVDSTRASWDWNLSGMRVDDFSAAYAGKIFQFDTKSYKFYDSGVAPKLEGFAEDDGSRANSLTQIDINDIRRSVDVEGVSTLAQAVATKLGGTAVNESVRFFSPNYVNGTQLTLPRRDS